MKSSLLAAVCASALSAGAAAALPQDPPRPPESQTTFRSGVDLVPVDVNVLDRDGRPIEDLKPGDFVLTVDGTPRKIVSAEFIKLARDAEPRPIVPHYSSNVQAAGGRLIMIVIDQGSISAGRGKQATDAADRFIRRLHPSDRVGLFAIPGAGPQIDFTANHAIVRSMLPRIVGQMTHSATTQYHVGISEALRVERGDEIAITAILDRECAGIREPAEIELCRQQAATEARSVAAESRNRTRNTIVSLRFILERLAETPAPKTVVFISEGLVVDREFSELSWLGPLAARGQLAMYVLRLDAPNFDAASARVSPTRSDDIAVAEEGLNLMAGLARGTTFRVVGNADYAFNRLALELSGYYLLGFEPAPGDRDGKPHKIRIDVPGRRGIEVRARKEFSVAPPRTRTDEELVIETLRSPLLASEIGLKLTTYTLREPGSGKLRILLAADIDRSANASRRLAAGFAMVDARARLVASQFEPDVRAPIHAATKSQMFVGAVPVDAPGVYTIKFAVLDDDGKRGSVEHSFRAQLATAGQIRATDLMIAESTGTGGPAGITPAVSGEFTSDMLHGYVELYSDAPQALETASVALEVAEDEDGRALDTVAARLRASKEATSNRRTAEGTLEIGLLPPGEYVARAVISIGGRKAGQVTRPFRVSRPAVTLTAPGEGAAIVRRGTAIPFTSRIDAFDKALVLGPQVVGFFLDRINVSRPNAAPPEAVEHARAGRFGEAADAVKGAGNDPLAATFLIGLDLYAKGELEAAAVKFRESLRINSEFFPAAFYLGACYAAGGRDREAAAAWQTSLVTESDAPFIYTLLGDAFLRQREFERALDILKEAVSLWPDHDQVQLRLATALAMNGNGPEALAVLDPYLEKHPQDHERLFVALRVLYEARAAGRSVTTPEEDQARFDRYARAYAAANGPQGAIVEQWRKFIEKK